MAKEVDSDLETRILLAAPTARDAEITRDLLAKAGLTCLICPTLEQLTAAVKAGAGALLLTEEALTNDGVNELLAALNNQDSWSELPVVVLMQGGSQSPVASRVLSQLRNVTLLERPAPMRSVVSALQAAVRGRERQYQIRDHIQVIRRGEAQSSALQQQLELAVEASELGTFHCPMPLGKIVWNVQCKQHFGLPADAEVDFERFYSILHPDDRERTRQAIAACVNQHQPYNVEYRTVWPDGTVRWIRATGRTFYDESNQPVRFDGTTQDITERKRVERERDALLSSERAAREEAERVSRVKDEFLATLSHELRTPLNAIFGWAQLLKRGKDDPEMVEQGIDVIDRNVRIQAKLIEDLLDMSRIISGKVRLDVQGVDLPEVISAAIEGVQPAAEAKGIRLEKVVDPVGSQVSGDPGRLQQILWNLLTNAIKFTSRGGQVLVRLERVNSQIHLSVADTGEGIDAEFVPHLFERFSQADASTRRTHGGLGLGLSIVKSLVEMHGGTVSATSPGLGQGATFTITLPVRATRESEEVLHAGTTIESSTNCNGPRLDGLKVLVVDDEADARELVKRLLDGCGAVPAIAASAEEAQKLLLSFQPDVILSDIGMPHQDGYEFIRQVRKQGVKIPAVALTAFARSEDRIRSIGAGYQSHLPKPVEPAELLAVIAGLSGRFGKVESSPARSHQ